MIILYDLKTMSNNTSIKFELNRKDFNCHQNPFPKILLLEQEMWNLHLCIYVGLKKYCNLEIINKKRPGR